MKRPQFRTVFVNKRYAILEDIGPWNHYPTITNNPEYVVKVCQATLGGRRLLYFDSEGALSELVVKDGKFAGFRPVDVMPPDPGNL